MNYNNNLQTNNTNLQRVLNLANNLPTNDASGKEVKKWILTMEDGSTIEKYVEIPKVYTVAYQLADGITSSNTATTIAHGATYETTLDSRSDGGYLVYEYITVWEDSTNIVHTFHEVEESPWLCHISIPNVTNDITIVVKTLGHVSDLPEGWE